MPRSEVSTGEHDLRRAREAAEARFRATFEQAAVGIAHVGLDGRWLLVNQKLCDIVGFRRDELLHRTFQEITHPDDLESDLALVDELLAGRRETYSLEKRYIRRDGSVVWINLTVSLVCRPDGAPDYFISVVENIDDRKRTEAELQASEALLRLSQAVGGIGSFEWDLTRGRVRGSARWAAILGLPAREGEIGYEEWLARIDLRDRPALLQTMTRVLAERRTDGQFELRLADDPARWIEVRLAYQYDPSGRTIRALGIHRDITEQKEREAELERRVAERTKALANAARLLTEEVRRREEAQSTLLQAQKLEALGQITGGVAHDFNNLLMGISGNLELIERRASDDRTRRYLANAKGSIDRAAYLTKQLLAFSRRQELTPTSVDIAALFVEVESLLRQAVGPTIPPYPGLDLSRIDEPDCLFIARVQGDPPSAFRFLQVGAALTVRLGRSLEGEEVTVVADDDMLGALDAAYRRCARSGKPSLEYARFDVGDGAPVRFERLLLPFSADGRSVTHLVGMARFTDLDGNDRQAER